MKYIVELLSRPCNWLSRSLSSSAGSSRFLSNGHASHTISPHLRQAVTSYSGYEASVSASVGSGEASRVGRAAEATLLDVGLELSYDANYNSTNFQIDLCSRINSTVTYLSLNRYGLPNDALEIPQCIRTNAPGLHSFLVAGRFNFSNGFAALPSSLLILSISGSVNISSSPTPGVVDGFTDDGALDWNEFFTLFPALAGLSLSDFEVDGTLPTSLPSSLTSFEVVSIGLSGTIPSTIFSNYTSGFRFDVSFNSVSGTIPASLFDDVATGGGANIFIDFASNALEGPLPVFSDYYSYITLNILSLRLEDNKINGTIPSKWIPQFESLDSVEINLRSNRLGGTIPQDIFNRLSDVRDLRFDVGYNHLEGSVPASILGWSSLDDSGNTLSWIFMAPSNSLNGTIPTHWFCCSATQRNVSAVSFTLDLSSNNISGELPAATDFFREPYTNSLFMPELINIDLSYNHLSGTIHPSWDSYFGPNGIKSFNLAHNHIVGPIPAICSTRSLSMLNLNDNELNGTLPAGWSNCGLDVIFLGNNPRLSGTIPPFFLNRTGFALFQAFNTSLVGDLPSTTLTTHLDLSFVSGMNFCSSSSIASINAWNTNPSQCDLQCTQARECSSFYSSKCNITCTTNEPVAEPIALPSPPPASCPPNTRPSPEFTCVDGIWYAPTVVSTPTLTVPSGAGTIIVQNITSSTIVFNGLGSSVNVSGCASNLTSIIVELTESEAKQLGKSSKELKKLLALIGGTNDTGCIANLSNVVVTSKVKSGGCSKVTASRSVVDGGSTLGAFFIVDSSGCNRWWIILVSVLCAMVIVGTAAAVVAYVLWKRHLEKQAANTLFKLKNG